MTWQRIMKAVSRMGIGHFIKFPSAMGGIVVLSVFLAACSGSDILGPIGFAPPDNPGSTSFPPETIFTDDHGVPMALVPAGPFEMGSHDGGEDERPVHTVLLDEFYIDQFEVTNGQYDTCVVAGVCDPTTDTTAFESSYSRRVYYGNPVYLDFPVIYVNWNEARDYCEWRGGRLPTEAEWEKAARGGLIGKKFPWGDEAPLCEVGAVNGAKFDDDQDCNDNDTTQVGSYSPNGYGLYDMAGNIWEWVSDFYAEDYYAKSPEINPTGPEDGSFVVIRGGSWNSQASLLRVSDRRFNHPGSGTLDSGFRCVREAAP